MCLSSGICMAGVRDLGLAQLPISLMSALAVVHLSSEQFSGAHVTPRSVCLSQGLFNLAGAWLGVMPCCHGVSGIAAHVSPPPSIEQGLTSLNLSISSAGQAKKRL